MNPKREKCAASGREMREIQREYLREVMRKMRAALEKSESALYDGGFEPSDNIIKIVKKALEAARRLGL